MMYATPEFYHMAPMVYAGTQLLMKQELEIDLTDADRPVDMSLSAHDNKRRARLDGPINIDHMNYKNDGLFSFMNSYQCLQTNQNFKTNVCNKADLLHMPPLEHQPLPASSSLSSSSLSGARLTSSSDGNLIVPEITSNGNNTGDLSDTDLLSPTSHQRAKREFVPDNKKDDSYWCKRLKNNDSARKSRVKRKAMEKLMETKLVELQKENIELKHEVAALKRRYGEEECSLSDSSSSRKKTSTRNPVSPPSSSEESSNKMDDEQQSSGSDDVRSSDDSRSYSMRSVTTLSRALGSTARDRADSIGSSSSSMASGRISASSRPNSRGSQPGCADNSLRTDVSGALDLTSDYSNRSTPAWEYSSADSFTSISTNSNRRNSCISSDSSGLEETNSRIMVFPLKCRWKRENFTAHAPLIESRRKQCS